MRFVDVHSSISSSATVGPFQLRVLSAGIRLRVSFVFRRDESASLDTFEREPRDIFWPNLLSSGPNVGTHATTTPRLISTADHSIDPFESVYVASLAMLVNRIAWTMVTKKPKLNTANSAIFKRNLSAKRFMTGGRLTDLSMEVQL